MISDLFKNIIILSDAFLSVFKTSSDDTIRKKLYFFDKKSKNDTIIQKIENNPKNMVIIPSCEKL